MAQSFFRRSVFRFCGRRCAADWRRDGMTLGERMMDTLAPELLLREPPVHIRRGAERAPRTVISHLF